MDVTGIVVLGLLLAWVNGANDVAKGIATLAGSGAANARRAVIWGTVWTVTGGFAAIAWGGALVSTFTSGYLAPGFRADLVFVIGTLAGAFLWVLVATQLALPVSTTHALLGGIVGAGLMAAGPDSLHFAAVANKALLPLLVSPLLAIVLCSGVSLVTRLATRMGRLLRESPGRRVDGGLSWSCLHQHPAWSALHWLSSAAISFARGLNDVPKIAAFLILASTLVPELTPQSQTLGRTWPILAVTLTMGLGSLWGGFRVLRVLAHRVTTLDPHSGLIANAGTSVVVLLATPLGLPVSTTHVSTGALMGIRWAERGRPREADALKIILLGWVVTLPVAAALSALSLFVVRMLGPLG
jgi:Phosphate/sulphate permeases